MSFDWTDAASRMTKAEIARAGVTLAQLARRMQALGVQETEASLKNKLYRGSYSLVFFMQCMRALGHSHVDVGAVIPADVPSGRQLDGEQGPNGR